MALLLSILLFCVNIITGATFNDFKLCVQLSDKSAGSSKGEKECTDWLSNGDSKSDWAGDKDWYDPEYIRVGLKARKVSKSMKNIDFRFCIQVTDHSKGPNDNGEQKSDWECTNWATKGEDWSDWAYDDNKYDFDSVRVKIETKKESGIKYIKSVGAGVRAANKDKDKDDWSKGNKKYTSFFMLGSSSKDESWTDWAYGTDKSDLDMDALRIFVDAEFQKETTTGGAGTILNNIINKDKPELLSVTPKNDHNYYGYIVLIGIIAFILINNIFIGCWCIKRKTINTYDYKFSKAEMDVVNE